MFGRGSFPFGELVFILFSGARAVSFGECNSKTAITDTLLVS